MNTNNQDVAIQISNLHKKYINGPEALKGVNLQINKGDFFGLLGANGAGKTTLIGCLTSLVQKTNGKISINQTNIDENFPKAKTYLGVVPQEFNFNIFEKVIDTICYQAGFYGIPRKEALKRAEPILKRLQLWEKKDQPARNLSGGMKRRLMIARALIHNPQILILDEPTAGVDVELRVDMWDYLRELNQKGLTILLTTHYLEEAEQLTNKIAIIQKGTIIANDLTENLLNTLAEESFILTTSTEIPKQIQKKLNLIQKSDLKYEVVMNKNKSIHKFFDDCQQEKIDILDIRPAGNRLEQLYLQITSQSNA